MRNLISACCIFILCGCATPYIPSEEALRIQQSLTDDEAMNKLVDYMSRNSKRAGLCEFTRSNWPRKGSVSHGNLVGISSGKREPFLNIDFSRGLTRETIDQMNTTLREDAKMPNPPTTYPPLTRDGTSVVFFGESKTEISSVVGDNNMRTTTYRIEVIPTRLNLANVSHLYVWKTPSSLKICREVNQDGYLLFVYSETDPQVYSFHVNIEANEIHGFIGALRRLYPKIELKRMGS